jgi:hypothetical protein
MKKFLILGVIAVVAVAALGFTGLALAQDQEQPEWEQGVRMMQSRGRGPGMQGMQSMMQSPRGASGLLHDYMHTAMAEALGLTPAELDEQVAAGETFYSLAQAQGLTDEEIRALHIEARTSALEAAVADEVITQDQADWMLSRMSQMSQNGAGQGPCHGGTRGPRGPRSGQSTTP